MTKPDPTDDISMNGKVIFITGSTDGIGQQTASELARLGATVLIHGRNSQRIENTIQRIHEATGNTRLEGFSADFSSLGQVRFMAEKVLTAYPRLDVLIHNAGLFTQNFLLSEDGYELTFAVNHLAPFLLTHLLQGRLITSAPSRVIIVASATHMRARLDFDNLQAEHGYNALNAYNTSKLCNVLFSFELAEHLSGTGVTVNCLHPGVIGTKILHPAFSAKAANLSEGAQTPVYLASTLDVEGMTGMYFEHNQPSPVSLLAQDRLTRTQLWDLSQRLAGIK